jgi:AcrR family transcriptional regulator
MTTAPNPPPARLPTEARQAEIVNAALRLAQSTSPASITTTDLAHAMGLSQGALFKHFANKDAIWVAVMEWVSENLLRELQAAAASADEPIHALQNVFDAHVNFVVNHSGVPRIIFHELQQAADSPLKQQVRDLMQSYRQLLMRLLANAVQRGEASADLDISAAATLLMGIVQGLVMQSMFSGQVANMKEKSSQIFALYVRGITTP